jgi:ferrous iron transport protein A
MKLRSNKKPEYKTLAETKVSQKAKVVKLLVEGLTRRRLLDLGLLPGTEVKAIMKSPTGDPTAYDIRGSVLALRFEDASKIVVNPISSRHDEEAN